MAASPPFEPFETRAALLDARDLWCSDRGKAEAAYGPVPTWNVSKLTDISHAWCFRDSGGSSCQNGHCNPECRNFDEDINGWDVSRVTRLRCTFSNQKVFNSPLDRWDVSRVENMQQLFEYNFQFNQSLASWNVSRVSNMNYMFRSNWLFNDPGVSKWETSSLINSKHTFSDAMSFNQALPWDVSKVLDMSAMFNGANSFNHPSVSQWDVSSVTDMANMFAKAVAFNQSLAGWDTSRCTNMAAMFQNARAFNAPLPWNTSRVKDFTSMFENASKFNQPLAFDTHIVGADAQSDPHHGMVAMFKHAGHFNQSLNFNLSGFDQYYLSTSSAGPLYNMFAGARSLSECNMALTDGNFSQYPIWLCTGGLPDEGCHIHEKWSTYSCGESDPPGQRPWWLHWWPLPIVGAVACCSLLCIACLWRTSRKQAVRPLRPAMTEREQGPTTSSTAAAESQTSCRIGFGWI